MNMKKTIAAISAATVAMSAIATTVSAEDTATDAAQGSFTYDLVRETKTREDGTASITTSATGLYIDGAKFIYITLENDYLKFKNGTYTVSVKDATGATNNLWTREMSPDPEAANYSTMIKSATNKDSIVFAIPVDSTATDGVSTATYGKIVDVTITGTVKHEIDKDAQKVLNATADTIVNRVATNTGSDLEVDATISATDASFVTLSTGKIFDFAAAQNALAAIDQWEISNNKDTTPATVNFLKSGDPAVSTGDGNKQIDYIKGTYSKYADYVKSTGLVTIDGIGAANDLEIVNNWLSSVAGNENTALSQIAAAQGADTTDYDGDSDAAETQAKAMWEKYMGAIAYVEASPTEAGSKIGTLRNTILGKANQAEELIKAYKALVDKYNALVLGSDSVRTTNAQLKYTAVTNAGEKVHLFPMMTSIAGINHHAYFENGTKKYGYTPNILNNSTWSNANGYDLFDYLACNDTPVVASDAAASSEGKVGYVNAVPVINDIIANSTDVTFTFTTSKLYVNTKDLENGKYGEGFTEKKDDYWYHPTFGQHLYDAEHYGTENSGYVGTTSAWAFNLFTGGLAVNSWNTMALNDVATFDWGESTLSFDWETISAGKKVNGASYALTYMNLFTSVEWFWDSFTVTYTKAAAEDVGTGAGDEAETDVVEEEEVVEETEAPVEEETEAEETEAPVEEAENPTTGNAPIALAVIPVALAAAAVVAKKRG